MTVRTKDEGKMSIVKRTFSVSKDWLQVREIWYICPEGQMEEQKLV